MPEDYLNYKISGETEQELKQETEDTIYRIIKDSQVDIPNKLLNGYLGDTYSDIKYAAEMQELNVNEYVKSTYNTENYKEFIKRNEEAYKEDIKEDLVYQALAKALNITVEQSDIEEYYLIRIIEEGYSYDDLKNIYGEELLYRSTLQNKIEKELLNRFSKQ